MADEITDADGRVLTVREMPIREKLRMIRQFGPASDVSMWFGQVMIATCVTAIDGVPLPVPVNAEQGDRIVETVGPAGTAAVVDWWNAKRAAEEAETDKARKARIKNLPGTQTSEKPSGS